jgi:hypothetical protein
MGRASWLACVVMFSLPSLAMAQEAASPDSEQSQQETVLSNQFPLPPAEEPVRRARRADTSTERLGIGPPPLRLFSELETGVIITSNVDRARGGAKGDYGIFAAPELRLESNWSRHALRLRAGGEGAYFARSGEFDIDTLGLNGDLRLDVRRTTQINLDAAFNASPASATTTKLDREMSGGIAVTHDFGFADATARGGLLLSRPGEDDSDPYIEPSLTLRGTLNTQGGWRPFAEVAYAPRIIKGAEDTQGATVAAGVAFEREPFVTGELAGVYTFQKGEELTQAFGVRGSATWTPTDFTAFTLSSDVEIEDEGRKEWTAALDVNYLLTDDITLFAGGSGAVTSLEDQKDRVTLRSNAGVSWALNANLAWSLRYENLFVFDDEKTDEHRAIATVILRR